MSIVTVVPPHVAAQTRPNVTVLDGYLMPANLGKHILVLNSVT